MLGSRIFRVRQPIISPIGPPFLIRVNKQISKLLSILVNIFCSGFQNSKFTTPGVKMNISHCYRNNNGDESRNFYLPFVDLQACLRYTYENCRMLQKQRFSVFVLHSSIITAFVVDMFMYEYTIQKEGRADSVVEKKIKELGLGIDAET